MEVTMLCLANSRKEGGRCVAGIRIDTFEWIRPVSDREHGELEPRDYKLDDDTYASLLDIICLDVEEANPELYQPENWLIDEEYQWQLITRVKRENARILLDNLINNDDCLFGNTGDCVKYASNETGEPDNSLCLIEPTDVSWVITKSVRGRRQTRAMFTFNDAEYNLVVTDPSWESELSNLEQDIYPHNQLLFGDNERPGSADRLLFTVSLGLPFGGQCYKLVAGAIWLPNNGIGCQ